MTPRTITLQVSLPLSTTEPPAKDLAHSVQTHLRRTGHPALQDTIVTVTRDQATQEIHHLAFRGTREVSICGSGDGGELSLSSKRITCEECRRICELGPLTPEESFALDEERGS